MQGLLSQVLHPVNYMVISPIPVIPVLALLPAIGGKGGEKGISPSFLATAQLPRVGLALLHSNSVAISISRASSTLLPREDAGPTLLL